MSVLQQRHRGRWIVATRFMLGAVSLGNLGSLTHLAQEQGCRTSLAPKRVATEVQCPPPQIIDEGVQQLQMLHS